MNTQTTAITAVSALIYKVAIVGRQKTDISPWMMYQGVVQITGGKMNSSVPATERDRFWLEENQYTGYDLEKFSNHVDRLTENHWTEEKARQEVAKMLGLKRKPRDNWDY